MKTISALEIKNIVKDLCIKSNYILPDDVKSALNLASKNEVSDIAKETLGIIIENYKIAASDNIPICQDTGMTLVFLEIGQQIYIDGDLESAINDGVRQGYEEGFLRKSVVSDPLTRKNTTDNTPAMIYYDIVKGDKLKITVAPKGFGSENMSQIKMLKPSDGLSGIKEFVLKVVKEAGPNPCPPIVVGIGIGGTFDKAALISKTALMKDLDIPNPDPFYAQLEKDLLEEINALDIGPQGFGGKTTALAVKIQTLPTHIAGLPCAVNINCHACRHFSVTI